MPPKSKPTTEKPSNEPERLQKVLAAAGLGSRRHCEEYILAGRVTIDGETAQTLGVRVDPFSQKVHLDGELLRLEKKKYFLLNKPAGTLCTNNDPAGRQRVVDLFPEKLGRLFTVGRLDENSEGLLLVTNDGNLANRLTHPRYKVPRTYHVQVAGSPTQETFKQLREGIYFTEGKFRVSNVKRLKKRGQSTFLEIILTEGKNREIRRLLARVGHKVLHLQRVSFGPLHLGRLARGRFRELKSAELSALKSLIETGPNGSSRAASPGPKKFARGGKRKQVGTSSHKASRKKTGSKKTAVKRSNSKRTTNKKSTRRKR